MALSDPVLLLIAAVPAVVACAGWAWRETRHAAERAARDQALIDVTRQLAVAEERLRGEETRFAEKTRLLDEAQAALKDAFGSLSRDALKSNSEMFMAEARRQFEALQASSKQDLAAREKAIEALVGPVRETLGKFDQQVQALEKTRLGAYTELKTQLASLADSQRDLKTETGNLVKALRAPHVRGRWGELTLKRAVEMAGMLEHCDFVEQDNTESESGRLRPDMVVRMPGGKRIVVDAKVPLAAYLEALEATDEDVRRQRMLDHARQLRDHINRLSSKQYWAQYPHETPEFVVLFIPGEVFYAAALQADPTLIETATAQKVMLASPANLIPLLRAVHYGWQQEAIAANARDISALGREMHDRLRTLAGYWSKMGSQLSGAVKLYNQATSSLESRVLVSARKFQDLKATTETLDVLEQIEQLPREPGAPELLASTGAEQESG